MRKLFALSLLMLGLLAVPGPAADDDEKLKPTNLPLNTDADEDEPHVADGGLTLYYGIIKGGKEMINVATRKTAGGPWSKPSPIETYVSNKGDIRGVFAPGGQFPQHLVFAVKDKVLKNYDLYVAVRQEPRTAWTAPTPIKGEGVNTPEDEAHPWMTADGKSLYFSRKTKGVWKVFVSKRTNASGPQGWTDPKDVGLPAGFHHATLMPDGKTMYLQGPVENDRWALFVSTHNGKAWREPVALAALNDGEGKTGDLSPNLSRDGKFLYFASDRPGGKGGLDLYWIETAKLGKK